MLNRRVFCFFYVFISIILRIINDNLLWVYVD